MSVDDNYREAIRKSAEELTPGVKSENIIRTRDRYTNSSYEVICDRTDTVIVETGIGTSVFFYDLTAGELESFWCDIGSGDVEFILIIDGVTTMTCDLRVFLDAGINNSFAFGSSMPLVFEDGLKTMLFRPGKNIRFLQSLDIRMRDIGTPNSSSGFTVSIVKE